MFDGRLYVLSDKSGCLARLASPTFDAGDDLDVDALWTVPGDRKAEGLIFREDGACYVGFDVKLADEPDTANLLLATSP